jgi:hypothetical protein
MNYYNSSPMLVFLSILYLFMSYVYVFTIKYLFYGKLYMFNLPFNSMRKRRWSEFMSEFDFGILYIKGKENVIADALSRRPHVFSLIPLKVNLREHVLTQLQGDSWHLEVTSNL